MGLGWVCCALPLCPWGVWRGAAWVGSETLPTPTPAQWPPSLPSTCCGWGGPGAEPCWEIAGCLQPSRWGSVLEVLRDAAGSNPARPAELWGRNWVRHTDPGVVVSLQSAAKPGRGRTTVLSQHRTRLPVPARILQGSPIPREGTAGQCAGQWQCPPPVALATPGSDTPGGTSPRLHALLHVGRRLHAFPVCKRSTGRRLQGLPVGRPPRQCTIPTLSTAHFRTQSRN